jgi:hypothetical protein
MPSLVRNGFDFQYVPQSTCDFGAQLMELITRALAGVVAAWIPIEGAQDRRHAAKAETSVRHRPQDNFAGQKEARMAQSSRDAPLIVNECGQQKPRRFKPGFLAQ